MEPASEPLPMQKFRLNFKDIFSSSLYLAPKMIEGRLVIIRMSFSPKRLDLVAEPPISPKILQLPNPNEASYLSIFQRCASAGKAMRAISRKNMNGLSGFIILD